MNIDWQVSLDESCQHALLAAGRGVPLVDARIEAAIEAGAEQLWQAIAPDGEPVFLEQMQLRSGPLREQWDARGPGLLRELARLTEPFELPAPARVSLVSPLCGGYGHANQESANVTFEAVLTNPYQSLPEVLRLTWLLAQLGAVAREPAALVPAVLAAGEELELARLDLMCLKLALKAWRVDCRHPAEKLLRWWEAYRDSPLTWSQALHQLAD